MEATPELIARVADAIERTHDIEYGTNNRFSVNVQGGYTFRLKFGDGTRTTEAELGANANLIAAAPDLYAALADAESFIARHSGNGETDFRAKLNAVLKRARGES